MTKNKKTRRIPVVQAIAEWIIREQKRRKAKKEDRIFLSKDGKPLNRHRLLRTFYRILKKAGISTDGLDIHALRVTVVSHLLNDPKTDTKTVQDIAGHSSPSMTMDVYGRAFDQSKRDAIARLPYLNVIEFRDGKILTNFGQTSCLDLA